MLLLFAIRLADDHLFGKERLIPFTVRFFLGRLYDFSRLSFENRMLDLIVLVPYHCL